MRQRGSRTMKGSRLDEYYKVKVISKHMVAYQDSALARHVETMSECGN